MVVNFAQTTVSTELLKQVFLNVNVESCPLSFNFHLHTIHSDGRLQPNELIDQAIAHGLQGLAITDHHSIGGYQVASNYLDEWKCSHCDDHTPRLWTGVEINANLLGVEVHILGYSFDIKSSSIKPYIQSQATTGKYYQATNVISAIHDAGGLAVLAHPARYRKSMFDLIPAAVECGIDGVESFYAYKNPKPWLPCVQETMDVHNLASQYNLYNTCGTDTHGLNICQRL